MHCSYTACVLACWKTTPAIRCANMKLTQLHEAKEKLALELLQADRSDYEPFLSKESIDIHYGKLAKGYVDRFNAGEGDSDFNRAGAFLHNIYFPQLKEPAGSNNPRGASLMLINSKYGSYDKFKTEVTKVAMGIQGSGWVYMARNGEIKTIKNHALRSDIAMLIDWWEHSWFTDYGSDKSKYLNNFWKAVDWEVVNQRILT